MLTAVNCHGHQCEQDHTKEKSNKDLFEYVPVKGFHPAAKEMNIAERKCEDIPIENLGKGS
jgi:hypothetical protein